VPEASIPLMTISLLSITTQGKKQLTITEIAARIPTHFMGRKYDLGIRI
jgi:hypothetical protein